MILKMEKLSVFGMRDDRELLLRELMRIQCVQMRPAEESGDEVLSLTEGAPVEAYALEQRLSRYTTAISVAAPYAKKRGMFERKPRVGFDGLEDRALLESAEELCIHIERIADEIAQCRSGRNKAALALATLRPWASSTLPLELEGTKTTDVRYYLLPPSVDLETLTDLRMEQAPCTALQIASMDKEQVYLITVSHKSDTDALWEMLKALGATKVTFSGLHRTPAENMARISREIERADETLERLEKELKEAAQEIYPLQYGADALTVRLGREKAGQYLRNTERVICFSGWVPTQSKAEVTAVLDKYCCYYEFADPSDEEEPPILLKNNAFVAPYEAVTNMYSPPTYRGYDPNWIFAITYFIIFGMMLGDAGFGLILFLGGLVMSKKMDMEPGGLKLVRVITVCGISTTVWGVLYGSFFGDAIPVVSRVFFGREVNPFPPVLDPIADAMTMMVACLGIGVVHLFWGMLIKGYMHIKRKEYFEAIFDVGFWLIFELGLILWLVGMILGASFGQIGMYMAIGGAAGLILTQGREKKNPIAKIIFGIGSLYDITGFMSDVLSYSRILALGLATGVIAQVFNIIGTLLGGGLGILLFIPVFAVGSALNLGINTLGAYVHTARLHYVEFFGKFYESGGKPFSPLMAQTKYIVVANKEEQ